MLMAILGICGKMGNQIYEKYKDEFSIIGIDVIKHKEVETYQDFKEVHQNIDVVVDFSSIDAYEILKEALKLSLIHIS